MIIEANILVTDEEAEDNARLQNNPRIAIEARKWCPGAFDIDTVLAAHEPVEFNGEKCPGQTTIMTKARSQFTIKMTIGNFVKMWKDWKDKRDFTQDLLFPKQ